MTAPKFYRTVFEVEVLTEGPYDADSLEQLAYDITEGEASGDITVTTSEEVTRQRMAELLIAQGSDPEFLLGEGDDLDIPAELADPDRFCPTCGADIIGNDPHEPGCETGGEAFGACILTAENMATEDDCSTHDHEPA